MKQVYPVIFTQLNDKKNTVLIEVPDLELLTEEFGMADAVEMARDAIGLKGICYEDEGKEIPTPRTMSDIDISKGAFAGEGESGVSLVDIDFQEYRRRADNKTVRRCDTSKLAESRSRKGTYQCVESFTGCTYDETWSFEIIIRRELGLMC